MRFMRSSDVAPSVSGSPGGSPLGSNRYCVLRAAARNCGVLVVLLLVSAAASAATLSGTVRSARTGAPLPSMSVAAYTPAGELVSTATTNFLGQYQLVVVAGNYRLLAYDPLGFYATSFYDEASSFETSRILTVSVLSIPGIDFALVEGGRAAGQVIAQESGLPLQGIVVAAYNLDGTRRGFVETDVSGRYLIVLPPGDFKLAAYDETLVHLPEFHRDVRSFEQASLVPITAGQTASGMDFTLDLAVRITGRTYEAATGAGLGFMVIRAYDEANQVAGEVYSDAAGSYLLLVPRGRYRFVGFDARGEYATSFHPGADSFESSWLVALAPGDLAGVDFAMPLAGRIFGVVTTSSGSPLSGMVVAAYNPNGSLRGFVRTDANGEYGIVLPPGDFRLAAYDDGLVYAKIFHSGHLSFSTADVLQLVERQEIRPIDFALDVAARLSGTVRNRADGTPLTGITVAVYEPTGYLVQTTTTATDGAYVHSVHPSSFKLIAWDGFGRFRTSFYREALDFESALVVGPLSGQTVGGLDFVLDEQTLRRRRPVVRSSNGARAAEDSSLAARSEPGPPTGEQ